MDSENKNAPRAITKAEKIKIAATLIGVGAFAFVVYWAQSPGSSLSQTEFQANITSPELIAQAGTSKEETGTTKEDTETATGPESRARDITRKAALEQFVQALESYKTDNDNYPEILLGNQTCTASLKEDLEEYFPEGKIPVDPDKSTKDYVPADEGKVTCGADEGFLYATPEDSSDVNYILVAKVEDSANGNIEAPSSVEGWSKITNSDLSDSGSYYAVIKGSKETASADEKEDELFDLLGLDPSDANKAASVDATDNAADTDTSNSEATNSDTANKSDTTDADVEDEIKDSIFGSANEGTTTSPAASSNSTLPETGVPILGYLALSAAGAVVVNRRKRK